MGGVTPTVWEQEGVQSVCQTLLLLVQSLVSGPSITREPSPPPAWIQPHGPARAQGEGREVSGVVRNRRGGNLWELGGRRVGLEGGSNLAISIHGEGSRETEFCG